MSIGLLNFVLLQFVGTLFILPNFILKYLSLGKQFKYLMVFLCVFFTKYIWNWSSGHFKYKVHFLKLHFDEYCTMFTNPKKMTVLIRFTSIRLHKKYYSCIDIWLWNWNWNMISDKWTASDQRELSLHTSVVYLIIENIFE